MFSEDYIVRLIRQAMQVISRVLLLRREERYPEAYQALDQMLEEVTGMPAGMFKLLDDEAVYSALQVAGELDVDRLLIVADLLAAEGEVAIAQKMDDAGQSSLQRSLKFYLEAFFYHLGETTSTVQPLEALERILPTIDRSRLAPDMLLSLLSYDEMTGQYGRAGNWLGLMAGNPETAAEAGVVSREFYQRLLERPDSDLDAGGITRQEVVDRLRM